MKSCAPGRVHSAIPVMTAIEAGGDLAPMDAALDALAQPARGVSRCGRARASLPLENRSAAPPPAPFARRAEKPSRLLHLRHTVRRIEYRLTGSAFESGVLLYELTRRHFPDSYLKRLNLRLPPYVNIALSNQFPRSRITTHLTRGPDVFFGPFRSRASAERFEAQLLDLFQMRRCQEDLRLRPNTRVVSTARWECA